MAHVVKCLYAQYASWPMRITGREAAAEAGITEFVFKGNNQHPGTTKCGYLPFKLTQPDHC